MLRAVQEAAGLTCAGPARVTAPVSFRRPAEPAGSHMHTRMHEQQLSQH